MKVELEVPKKYEKEVKRFAKSIDWPKVFSRAFANALQERLEEEILFERAEKIVSKSKLTDKQALKLGEELKERVWKRHQKEGW